MTTGVSAPPGAGLTLGDARGRWVLAATIMGSGLALLDATIVNIALPSIDDDLDAGTAGLIWTVNAYTLTLASLILLGGSLGDRLGRRRVFQVGVAWFAVASLACAVSPNVEVLVGARALQGVGGALLTPGSLAILQSSFRPEARGRAIGAWSGFSGIAAALGPLAGGWLLELGSWRWIFLVNVPVALVVLLLARHVPESRDPAASRHTDVVGALLAVVGLGALTYGLTAAADGGFGAVEPLSGVVVGAAAVAAFVWRERRTPEPMLPLDVFRSAEFSATNLVTFAVYAAIGGLVYWLVVTLQVVSGLSPLRAGLSLLPLTVMMLLLSPVAGSVSDRIGPRLPMTVGPLLAAVGVAALTRVGDSPDFLIDVLLPVSVFGLGLTALVTPLTATVLAAVPDSRAGLASGVNNAVARTAGLIAVAVLPVATGLGTRGFADPSQLEPAFRTAMLICAGLLALGGVLSAVFVRHRPAVCQETDVPRVHCAVSGTPSPALAGRQCASRGPSSSSSPSSCSV